MKETIKIQDIADLLEAFEKENNELILLDELNGWNTWSLLKKPLYYLLKQKESKTSSAKPESHNKLKIKLFLDGVLYFFQIIYWTFKKKHADIIITSTGNKLGINKEGLYTDIFVDPLVDSGNIANYLYIEGSSAEVGRRPSQVKAHIFCIGRPIIIAFLHRYYISKSNIKNKALKWSEILNLHVSKNSEAPTIHQIDILNLLGNFWAEYKWYQFLWRIQKPSRLFIVDGIPSGSMAAARRLRIPVWEFQHGFVSHNKPDYIISKALLPVKSKMVVPDYICVFGDYFKELLLNSGFWNQNEIILLGSYAIEKARTNFQYKSQKGTESLNILWTTQPSVYSFTQKLLKELASHQIENVRFFIKPHPLEKDENLEWYKKLANDHAELFTIETNADFFQSLRRKHLLIGFYSTTLLEALSFGYPVVTIAAGQFDRGINNALIKDLSDVIKPVSDVSELITIINNLQGNIQLAKAWSQKSSDEGSYLFDKNYFQNLKLFVNEKSQK